MGHQQVTLDCVVNVRETSMYILSQALKKAPSPPLKEYSDFAPNFARQRQGKNQSVSSRPTGSRNQTYLSVLEESVHHPPEPKPTPTPFHSWMEHLDQLLDEVDRDASYMRAMDMQIPPYRQSV